MEIPFMKDKDRYILKVSVKTGSKKPGVEKIDKDKLKIRLKSQPYDGLANRELLEILSVLLSIPKSKIEIIKGITSKHKVIQIQGKIE